MKGDPFKDLVTLQERMSRIFDEAVSRYKVSSGIGAWSPPADIYETDDVVIIKAEIPGIDMKEVDIEVQGDRLTIKGERRFDKNLKEELYHRMERFYGSFHRSFSLPNAVDRDGIKAQMKDGVLEVSLPKLKTGSHGVKVRVE